MIIVVMLVINSVWLMAQMEPVWESKANSEIIWNKFAPSGNLICGTDNEKTVALDPVSGKVLWTKNFDYGTFDILPNTPYIYYESNRSGLLVFDPKDGKELCNSNKMGMENIEAFYPIRAGNNFLVYTQMDDQEQFWLTGLSSGNLLWKQNLDLDDDIEIAGGFISVEEDPEAKGLMCDPVGDGKGGVFVAVHDRLIHFDSKGKIAWNIEYPSMFGDQDGFFKTATVKFSKMFPDKSGKNLYVFSGGYMSCFSAADGKLSWDKAVKVTGPVKNLIFEEEGMILIPASDNNAMKKHKINLVDYKTGKTKWGEEGVEFKGGYIQSSFCSEGIVFITKSYMNESYFFNIIDPNTGQLLLKKSLKLFPGPYDFEEVNGGILVSSTHGANIFNYDTKEFVINKELKTGKEDFLLTADAGNKVYFFNSAKNTIYEFDKSSLLAKQFNKEKIKLSGGDVATGMDLFRDGMVLYSAQNLIKFDYDGNILYKKYYAAPGQGWASITGNILGATFKVIGGLAQVAIAQASVVALEAGDQAARKGMHDLDKAYEETEGVDADLLEYRREVNEYEQGMDVGKEAFNEEMSNMAAMGVLNMTSIGGNLKAISGRFKNSKATKKYVLLMTKDKEHGGTGLAVVSKLDGEIAGFIPMKFSKENPSYTVDPFTNMLFWMPSLDSGTNTFGKYNDIKSMMKNGTVISFDLNAL